MRAFHEKCDHIRQTLTIVKIVPGFIFGAFTNEPWKSENKQVKDSHAFFSSLANKNQYPLVHKSSNHPDGFAIENHRDKGPCFDTAFNIENNSDIDLSDSSVSHSSFGQPTVHHRSYFREPDRINLAGSSSFKTIEIEVD